MGVSLDRGGLVFDRCCDGYLVQTIGSIDVLVDRGVPADPSKQRRDRADLLSCLVLSLGLVPLGLSLAASSGRQSSYIRTSMSVLNPLPCM